MQNSEKIDLEKKRIEKDLQQIGVNPLPGATIKLIDPNKPDILEACIDGPTGTVYDGGKFIIGLKLEAIVPYIKPVTYFKTKIFHPSISTGGAFCNEIVCTYWDDCSINWWFPTIDLRSLLGLYLKLLQFGQTTNGGYALNQEEIGRAHV